MTKYVKGVTPHSSAVRPALEPESMAQLLGDCARMAPHWHSGRQEPAPPARELHGISVPASSAALVKGMSEYGD
ncbi:hypothetical protein OEIGOIKO_06094 [Streptomyces chrestomyceticus JCM 4735]|uniref:Uncharacterized protein n=1 Tax=Streptomyces chrestomyceticus JCM 4735 TaxID=1306181 RepID=A0A7U9L0P9_9ACTN|nr:hypothetical protein [Streptomyces chrestomyceticus]GCD38282.1 hypothetical protein OEIGOIKO_06094 [Streptomyces chrestomyceticus JCM 4735]